MIWILQVLFSPLPTPALFTLIAFGALIFLWVISRPKPVLPPVDLNKQSVGIEGGARRAALLTDNNLISYYFEDTKTLYEAFQRGLHASGKLLCHHEKKNLGGEEIKIHCCHYYYSEIHLGAKVGVEILALQEAEELGRNNIRKPVPPSPEDLCIVCFTSGTTGNPKGAMLTHENVVANAAAFLRTIEDTVECTSSDVSISYLPLAHMFERVVQTVMYSCGAKVGFFQGDIKLLTDDMKTLKPTVFPVVPRLLNRIYDKVQSGANTPVKKFLLNFAATMKMIEVKQGIIRNDSLLDKLVFKKVQETMGGRVRIMVTGAAPISPSVLKFLRSALGCQVFEAYGQTECSAGCTFSMPGDWTTGHVGPPLVCNIIKLDDVEEMNYFSSNNEGEVCIKGPNVFKGYLKDPEKTAEAIDKDGWLHTGDVGKWMPNGTLKIIDRKKNIFKLAQGEYIAPEKIENVYIRSVAVAQVFVHGESLRSCLIGIVVPDAETLPEFAAKLGVKGSYEDICKNPAVKKAILEDLVRLGKAAGLKSFEQVKDLYIHTELFSVENGLLTPTLKAKRAELVKVFQKQIEALYSSMHE
uniref:Long-chain-fatty-acid--CoA ligase n=1 Tax=Pavo cristatus TaxID=9049 RepID=A0A8C9FMH7_PAVCR